MSCTFITTRSTAEGDHASTENEVFNACEEAVEEIYFLVRKLTSSANTIHYIITATMDLSTREISSPRAIR